MRKPRTIYLGPLFYLRSKQKGFGTTIKAKTVLKGLNLEQRPVDMRLFDWWLLRVTQAVSN